MYVGEWAANKRAGHGTWIRADGASYEGPWLDDRMHGMGGIFR
jgi:hypothetical protein